MLDINESPKFVGSIIREKRKAKGWHQSDLAEFASLNRNYIGEIERGESNPSIFTLLKISKALGLNGAEELFGEFQEEMFPYIMLLDENEEVK
ncbi:helix-turn-helix domain-containing protein [Sutcliffiella sp. NC1]|uniref:helix-turn-helix domain-containing protein n=1 Tax=Sutcliffiella sp. NC1 TaxID=3004096 RepID=UPI0022DD29BE|nr:helix-turn-helix transcriptional regulator [Sutcliffiella sp. NC1]WBL14816.1 helix-turn-helix transcriptional regulator [Sutcliffiella sp. NC1]